MTKNRTDKPDNLICTYTVHDGSCQSERLRQRRVLELAATPELGLWNFRYDDAETRIPEGK